jgi:predicted DNA-binding transcriptional regulator AlpA
MATPRPTNKKRYHIDRRANRIAAGLENSGASPDKLYTTKQLAHWFETSEQWLERERYKATGPPFVRLGPRCIRYRQSDVLAWLNERASSAKEVA